MNRKLALLTLIISLFTIVSLGQTENILNRPLQHERSRQYDALHYKIELDFDLDNKSYHGSNTIYLKPLNNLFRSCSFDLTDLIISGVVGDDGKALKYSTTESSVKVEFNQEYSPEDTVVLRIDYWCKEPGDGILFNDQTDKWPQMVESNSWPDHARNWFPCYDHPNDKVTQEVIITAKDGLKVLSNGKLLGVKQNRRQGTSTWHWKQFKPHSTYLSMLAIGPFVVIEDSLGDLPINYWVYEQDEEVAREIFKVTPGAIAFFNKIYNYKYPWAKYDQVVAPHQGGGAEATSATILGLGSVRHSRPDQDDNWERIIAHEVAHQWWGDLITLRSWEHTWMNESFATYSDYLYTRAMKGEDKGAIVLHMLRYQLGDDAFFRVLSTFLHKHEFQAVDTHDFTKTVKEVTGKNMDWFFDQFIFKAGHPVFDISYDYSSDNNSIELNIKQIQDRSIGTPIYKLPVQIGITTSEGKEIKEIWITKEEETFTIPTGGKPLMVRFDEGNWLLKEWTFEKTKEELEYQSKNDDIIGKKWASSRLKTQD